MSWSVSFIGKPEDVAKALEANSDTFGQGSEQSKLEYDAAKPHLIGLVKQNFVSESSGYVGSVVKLDAAGSGHAKDGEQLSRSCTVKLENFYSKLV